MSLKKSNFLIAGAAVLLAGGLATYFYFKNLEQKVSKSLETAKVVPASAIMATFISPNPQALAQLEEFGTPEVQKLITGGLDNLQQEALAEANIDFDTDIKPWVGGIMVALLPAQNPESTETIDLLIVVGIKNKIKAGDFFNKLQQRQDIKIEDREYQGVEIEAITDGSGDSYYAAVLGDFLAIAPSFEGATRAIDTFQGKPSFASKHDAASIMSESAGVKNPLVTVFVPDYKALIEQFYANVPEGQQLPPSTIETLKSIKYLVMGLGIDSDGMRFRAVSKLSNPIAREQSQSTDGKLLAKFPAETMALVSTEGISNLWFQMATYAEQDATLNLGIQLMRQGLANYGLDVDDEVFGWMDGEFVMGAIASNEGVLGQVGLGGAMVWETSDRATAEKMFAKLDAIAADNAPVSLQPTSINGKQVTEWQLVGMGTVVGHGWLDENTVFVGFGSPVVELITANPRNALNKSSSFEGITASLPRPNQGYFYVDMEQVVSWLEGYPYAAESANISEEGMVLLKSIRGIGVTGAWRDLTTSEIEMLFALKRNK